MKKLAALLSALAIFTTSPAQAQDWSIAIHGGAGTLQRDKMTPEMQVEYEAALQRALDAGADVLKQGGSAMDAIQASIVLLENDPHFNAGRGAVFTWEGENELDAAIMDGRDRSAGAVTGVKTIKNPILLAETVRQDGRHVFLSGAGAEEFAKERGLETAPPEWFATEPRRKALERVKADPKISALEVDLKFGTVGAVALDQNGNVAAGTSTGGMTGKRWGRIGDAPVIGAGTYADNRSCAVSATGWGEFFIRVGVAHEICTQLRMAKEAESTSIRGMLRSLTKNKDVAARRAEATRRAQSIADAVMADVAGLGGDGGVILVTPEGDALFSFNTSGMYRGRATSSGVNEVAIFGGEAAPSSAPEH
ncbi:isoaspartyl peptidase/L-asparaginase family protein [Altererythrobacter litoralis]|uniref:Isoaspartyl peptidase/L-asparaginase n=1 Tax=Altererythrobacter litoralis TaxID=3113904 RepID=A0ABU7GG37_9SPHN|nr:isoaspartyl peptidase/L-asparaginase [Erythrobacteraceae bacterium 1XM1-14]